MITIRESNIIMNNLISIVLPVYNGEKRIGRSIDSIIGQTYSNWELIIVNDHSTDNTLETIKQYADSDERIKIINNEENRKLPVSLNIGFASATGEYLTWTSDDNLYHSDALGKMARILDENKGIDLVYADNTVIGPDGTRIKESPKDEPDELRFRNVIGACFLYRRGFAQTVGEYDPDLFLAEDYEFFLRCYKSGTLYHISESLYDYRIHDESLTATRLNDILKQTYRVLDKHFDFLYSKCLTRHDRHRLFFSMLYYHNSSENDALLKRFYSIDPSFRLEYTLSRIKARLKESFRQAT